jgi:hypothetical protein
MQAFWSTKIMIWRGFVDEITTRSAGFAINAPSRLVEWHGSAVCERGK